MFPEQQGGVEYLGLSSCGYNCDCDGGNTCTIACTAACWLPWIDGTAEGRENGQATNQLVAGGMAKLMVAAVQEMFPIE